MEELNSSSDEAIFYDATSKVDFDQANNCNIETLKNPDLEIAQLEFWLRLPELLDDESKRNKLLECITKNCMAPYYQHVCNTLNWTVNTTLLNVCLCICKTLSDAIHSKLVAFSESESAI